jgi:tetratricopeptide (TPR) repeat protein
LDILIYLIMSQCARPDCQTIAKSSCSSCGREQYCGSDCQKLDWKAHKLICPILKKLPNKLQSYKEAVQIINEILTSNKGNNARILEHLLSYADYQFGEHVAGSKYRERSDGQRIDNWNVDISIFLKISTRITDIYVTNQSLSTIIRHNKAYPSLERSLHILSPWMVTINSDANNQSNGLSLAETNYLLDASSNVEGNMATVTINRSQFDVAEGHCHRRLAHSRKLGVEGEDKTTSIFEALRTYVILRQHQGDYSSAVSFAEEAYNVCVDANDPVHPQVQQAAGMLINSLIHKGDFFNAERFAEQTYQNLRDIKNGMDQEGEEVAKGAYNLADVIHRQDDGDLIKAEKLARESLRIRTRLYSSNDHLIGTSCMLLGRILMAQGKFGDETKELLKRSLDIDVMNEGLDGLNTAVGNISIGRFYYKLAMIQSVISIKRTHLLLAKSYAEEATRIETKIHNPSHSNYVSAASLLSDILRELSII